MLIRQTLPAMAVTLVIFVAVQVLMPTLVRPHLISPVRVTAPFNANANNGLMLSASGDQMTLVGNFNRPGAWVLSGSPIAVRPRLHRPGYHRVPEQLVPTACSNWLNSLHLRQQVSYQPASRFWPLQGIEIVIYLVLAAGLGSLCAWRIRRRRA